MIDWLNDKTFKMGSVDFTIDITPGSERRQSLQNNFTLVKTKGYIQNYLDLDRHYKNILELGLFQDGALVFFDQLFKPEKIVGVELSKVPIDALNEYIKDQKGRVKAYYGTSQGDINHLEAIVTKDFGGQLDLVIDDASHLYELTRASFVTLFPLLQPGGMYIIEDWAWSHRQNAQVGSHPWQDQPALTNLIYQLISELGGSNNIEDILINNNMVKIRKKKSAGLGSEVIQHSYLRGKKIPLI